MRSSDRKIMMAFLTAATLALVGIYLLDDSQATTDTVSTDDSLPTIRPAQPYYHEPVHRAETFPFDPNTADSAQLLRLGLSPWQVRNIYRYRAKGGIYRKKEDFARLYGLTVKDYRRLEPYIRISPDYLPATTLLEKEAPRERDTLQFPKKLAADERVDLNSADTAVLRRVPGIGRYYAAEILRYGRWLGGYVSVDQLDEIDEFPQEAKQYFVVSHPQPRQLNVNKLSLQQLRRHPYINYFQAKAIVDHRRLHGDLKSLDELRLLRDFPPEAIARLAPYVCY